MSRSGLLRARSLNDSFGVDTGPTRGDSCRSAVRPERALIEAPAEHREGKIEIIRSHHSGRRECANSGRPNGGLNGHIEGLTA